MIDPPHPRSQRMTPIQPFHVMALLARARELEAAGRDIVHMEIGEPDFTTPEPIVAAGRRALEAGHTHYTPATGLPALREAIAAYYHDELNVDVAPSRILVTPGASGALLLAMGVLVDPGGEVLVTDPGYPCNRNFVHLYSGRPIGIAVDARSGFQPTAAQVRVQWTPATVALLVASPANPTGTILRRDQLQALHREVRVRDGRMIVDEIYHGLIYGDAAASVLEVTDAAFVVNSFSKYFGMTGWRLGWLVAPSEYIADLDKLAQNLFLAAPTPAQHAALAAFTPETRAILEQRRAEFQARRDFLVPALRDLGFDIPITPDGAFYIYAGCGRFTDDSFAWCTRLLEDTGVALTPGLDFGEHQASQHVRFAYTTSLERLQEGVARLRRCVK